MEITIRQLEGEEMLDTLYAMNSYAFHPSPPFQNKEEWMAVVRERRGVNCQAAFVGERPVSISVSTSMTQNMRGKLFPASGIWGVSTEPSERHKGYCRQVMARLLAIERESGKAFSNLYPFRESFYERLGYVAFPLMKIARFSSAALSPLLKIDLGGEIILQLIGQAYEAYRAYLADMRLSRHGMAFFNFGDKGRVDQNLVWVARAEFDGKTEGLMLYRTTGEEVTKYNFIASRFYYQTNRARYLLLRWLAQHIDQVDRVEMWLAEDEYPETWLADMEVKVETAVRPAMCRVLDVEKISGMSIGDTSFSAHIIDPLCPWNEGDWDFTARDGKLQVSRASQASCELSIQGLSALVAGTRDPQDFAVRGWGNPSPDTQASLRRLFPKMRPYIHEMF
jgi:predicted acetyltransferase